MNLNFKKTNKNATVPTKGTPQSAMYDLYACLNDVEYIKCGDVGLQVVSSLIYPPTKDGNGTIIAFSLDPVSKNYVMLPSKSISMIPTGLIFDIPSGHCLKVYPRSGLSLKGINLANCTGVIDEDYVNETMVLLHNNSSKPFRLEHGMRIAQIDLCQTTEINFVQAEDISEKIVHGAGFGSTGA